MAFPRNSEGLLDIEAYVNLLLIDEAAAARMENELENENPEEINYFYDNLERVIEEVRKKNASIENEKLEKLHERYMVLEKQEQESMQAFKASMLQTLDGVKKDDGTPLTPDEKIALNDEMVRMELRLIEEFTQKLNMNQEPTKTQAQLEKEKAEKEKAARKEEEKRNRALFLYNVEITKQMKAQNPQDQATQSKPTSSATNHKNTHKNRGCTIF